MNAIEPNIANGKNAEERPAGQRHRSPPHFVPRHWRAELALYAGIFALLAAWVLIYPYTGDGDSVLHYLNARAAWVKPADVLGPWARPGVTLILMPFAIHGIIAARLFMAAVAVTLVWQTVRLAEDLHLPRAILAGAMVIWQPMAFAVAADTMTEIPLALGLVIAVRLWQRRKWALSCLVIGFLPAVRPEGFFFGAMWGVMVLFSQAIAPWRRRIGLMPVLAAGLVAWSSACRYCTGDWLFIYHQWSWPPQSYEAYGRGSLFHYALNWPMYSGVPLTLLFVLGLGPAVRRRETGLAVAAWALVFAVHSVLYWRGWFASCGLLRIMACTSPFVAVICLIGWDRSAKWFAARGGSIASRRGGAAAFAALCTGWTLAQYALTAIHYDCFPLLRCTTCIQDNHLVGPDTWFISGNQLAVAGLGFPPHRPRVVVPPCDAAGTLADFARLPLGAIAVWDNRQSLVWQGVSIEQLQAHGMTLLYETTTRVGRKALTYAVLRKDVPISAARN